MPECTQLNIPILAGSTATAIGITLLYKYLSSRQWHHVGQVSELAVHPMKSGRPIYVNEAICTFEGLQLSNGLADRHLIVANAKNGKMITNREVTRLILVAFDVKDNIMTLSMPTAPEQVDTIDVNLADVVKNNKKSRCVMWLDQDIEALDCGDEVAKWIGVNVVLDNGMDKRLYYRPLLSNYYNGRDATALEPGLMPPDDKSVAFQDLSAFMLATLPSLRDLNARLSNEVPMKQFRPNIIVDGDFAAWSEDAWNEIRIGEHLIFKNVKPCTRCVMTTIDVDRARRSQDGEPLKTLRKFRQVRKDNPWRASSGDSPRFGINLMRSNKTKEEYPISAGMPVYVR